MTDRSTPRGYIDTRQYTNRPVTTRSLVGAYGVALLIPVVLWAISEPLLAAGLAALVGGAYAVGRVGLRVVRRRHRVRTGTSAEAGSPRNRTAEPDP